MSKRLQLRLSFDESLEAVLASKHPEVEDFRIISKALDARGAPSGRKPVFNYDLEVVRKGESFSNAKEEFADLSSLDLKPLIIGAGPAGLFAAIRLSEYGIKSTIVERGDIANKRMLAISKYWKKGIMNTENNVCFGEGGAGLFSDGKLITRVKSPFIKYVMQKFVDFGAPEEVGYLSNPHLGSNKIRQLISKMTDQLKEAGHELFYNDSVKELVIEDNIAKGVILKSGKEIRSDHVILATGHSASDIYKELVRKNVDLKHKDFAVGVRIEHPREYIDKLQYGEYYKASELGTARYRLSHHNPYSDKGTYSFCMCPGGYVLSSGTDEDGIVVNGMSNYARNSRWSNSAIVVSVKAGEDFETDSALSGLDFQQDIERRAFELSTKEADGKKLPAMTVAEFISGKLNDVELPKTSCPSGIFKADLTKIFPEFIVEHLREGILAFDQKIKNFSSGDSLLIAPETRTSAPLTVTRDKNTFESTNIKGLYPCGEGAGYAGGITSAAVDGIKVVESIISSKT